MEMKNKEKKKIDYMKIIQKIEYNSPVILTFVLVTVVVYWLNLLTQGRSNQYLFSV